MFVFASAYKIYYLPRPRVCKAFDNNGLFCYNTFSMSILERGNPEPKQLLNSEQWHQKLEEEVAKAQVLGTPLSVAFIDLDHFKDVNDTLGHDVGDVVIDRVGKLLIEVHPTAAGRLGGDEFGVLVGTDESGAEYIKKHIFNAFTKSLTDDFEHNEALRAIGVEPSIGTATLEPGMTGSELLRKADESMYSAKRAKLELGRRQRIALYVARIALEKLGGIRLRDISKYETLLVPRNRKEDYQKAA